MKIDRYGRGWSDQTETCLTCGQPDNCGDCNHMPLAPEQVDQMGGVRYPVGGDDGMSRPLSSDDFAKWLLSLLDDVEGRPRKARPDIALLASEYVNGELRPCVCAFFPGGGYVISINTVSP